MTMFHCQGHLLSRPICSGHPCCPLPFHAFWVPLALLEVSQPHHFSSNLIKNMLAFGFYAGLNVIAFLMIFFLLPGNPDALLDILD